MESKPFTTVPKPVLIPQYNEIEAARERGRAAAKVFIGNRAPGNPVLRVAYADGLRSVDLDLLRTSVIDARAMGLSWQTLGNALGVAEGTARARFSGDLAGRMRRYHLRQAAKRAQAAG